MSGDLSDLYHEIVLDHGKRPRNFRAIERPDRQAEGFNPLCGDRVHVYVSLSASTIADLSFTGAGCAICLASASLMTRQLKGKSAEEARRAFGAFQTMLTGEPAAPPPAELGSLAALAGVRQYPMRVKCATLPWHTLRAALEERAAVISTE